MKSRLDKSGTVGFWYGTVDEGYVDGLAKRLATFKRPKQQKIFTREAFVIDGIVMPMNSKIDLFPNQPARASPANEMDTNSIAGLHAGGLRPFAHSEKSVIHSIRSGQQTQVGLQGYMRITV